MDCGHESEAPLVPFITQVLQAAPSVSSYVIELLGKKNCITLLPKMWLRRERFWGSVFDPKIGDQFGSLLRFNTKV